MANYRRLKIEAATYFFTLVLNERRNSRVLTDNFHLIKSALQKVKSKYPFKLIAMVVLPDHMHLIKMMTIRLE